MNRYPHYYRKAAGNQWIYMLCSLSQLSRSISFFNFHFSSFSWTTSILNGAFLMENGQRCHQLTKMKTSVEKQWIPCDILADLVLVDIFNRSMLVTSQVCAQPECHPDCQRNMKKGKVLWHRYQVEVGIGRHGVNFTVGFTILFGTEPFDGAVAIDKVSWSDILFR